MTLRRSLCISTLEGAFAELVGACAAGGVSAAWAIYLRLSPLLVGLLGALPFTALLVQLPTTRLSQRFGSRRTALWTIGIARQCVLPLALLPFVDLDPGVKQAVFLGCALAGAALGVVGHTTWTTWMGELVPGAVRNRYFGRRATACALATSVSSLAAGGILDAGGRRGHAGAALSALAFTASVAGALTTLLLRHQHPPHQDRPQRRQAAPARSRDPRARKLLAFEAAWSAAIGIAAAFYPIHMAQNLKMDFASMGLYGAGVAAIRMLTAPLWGRAIGRTGPRFALVSSAFALSLSPLLWLFASPGRLWPLAIDAVISGAAGAGLALATFHLPLALARPRERSSLLGTLAAAGGAATGLASAAGGALVKGLPAAWTLAGRPLAALHGLFLVGAAGRFLAALLGLRVEDRRLAQKL